MSKLLERLQMWEQLKEQTSFWQNLWLPDGHIVLNQEEAVNYTILMPFKHFHIEWIADDCAKVTCDKQELVVLSEEIPEPFHYVECEMHRDSNKVILIPFVEEHFIEGERNLIPYVEPKDLVANFSALIQKIQMLLNQPNNEEYSY